APKTRTPPVGPEGVLSSLAKFRWVVPPTFFRPGRARRERRRTASLALPTQLHLGLHHAFHRVGQAAFPADELSQFGVGRRSAPRAASTSRAASEPTTSPSGRRSLLALEVGLADLLLACFRVDLAFLLALIRVAMSKLPFCWKPLNSSQHRLKSTGDLIDFSQPSSTPDPRTKGPA